MYTLHLHLGHNSQRHKLGLDIGGLGSAPEVILGIDEKKIQSFSKRIIDIIEKTPNIKEGLEKAFSEMSKSILRNPENIKKLLDKITTSTHLDSKQKTVLMLEVMNKHSALNNNGGLERRIKELSEGMQNESIQIRAQTHLQVQNLLSSL